jgi:diguanylate cyclase (GGDEF)-like protein/PAS domain S-box-containing protein
MAEVERREVPEVEATGPSEVRVSLVDRLDAVLRALPPEAPGAAELRAARRELRSLGEQAASVQQRYVGLINALPDAVTLLDLHGRILEANDAACRSFRRSREEMLTLSVRDLNPHLQTDRLAQIAQVPVGESFSVETINVRSDGTPFPVEVHSAVFLDRGERRVIAVARDMTTRKAAETSLREAEARQRRDNALFAQAQALAGIGGWEWDPRQPALYCTEGIHRILQRLPGVPLTLERLIEHIEPADRLRTQTAVQDAIARGEPFDLECRLCTARGEARWARMLGRAMPDAEGALRVSGTLQDISESKQQQERLRRQALTDPLTGLANRDAVLEELGRALEHAGPERGPAVLYVDLDRFKVVNDLLGHNAGDALLAAAGRRLQEAAGEFGMVARFGGDEFLVLMPQTLRGVAPMALAEHIAQTFSRSFEYGGEEFSLTASIGLARYPDDGATRQQLINNADAAMSDAKRRGRNTWQRFNPALAEQQSERLLIETQLRRALDNQEFALVYQPQINMLDGKVHAAEVLLRWNNRVLGEMRPDRFIHHAETTGDIVRIGAWVMREACRQLRAWRSEGVALARVAVNVSFRQFLSDDFAGMVVKALQEFELDGSCLELEITERVLIEDAPDTVDTFARLKALGVSITIDDFGEGYSALNYLRRLPIDGLKISHTFMQGVPDNTSDADICLAIVRIAQSLGLTVIAEGVETARQRDFLMALGTEWCQGYFYSEPLSAAEFADYLRR